MWFINHEIHNLRVFIYSNPYYILKREYVNSPQNKVQAF